jgi:hypothetical protein
MNRATNLALGVCVCRKLRVLRRKNRIWALRGSFWSQTIPAKNVTHVLGTLCYPCLRAGQEEIGALGGFEPPPPRFEGRSRPLIYQKNSANRLQLAPQNINDLHSDCKPICCPIHSAGKNNLISGQRRAPCLSLELTT